MLYWREFDSNIKYSPKGIAPLHIFALFYMQLAFAVISYARLGYLRIMFLTDFMKSLYSFETVTDAAGALVCASGLPGDDVGDSPLDTALSQVNDPILISVFQNSLISSFKGL